ncbi:Hypothetical protein PHPALM_3242 [Phytophthora palmivora]|uniref:Polyprotein n=1 Tax=Phytophthora palmivora TaxID=4796 RepID=A0A2P4YN15_9STRA|nr:Hypothetical protein PHPALM_3242 [Phytophthora palmivora]
MTAENVWILDSGSSRNLRLEDVDQYVDSRVQPNGDQLNIIKMSTPTLRVTACGKEQTLKLVNVYYAENVVHNLISSGTVDPPGVPPDIGALELRRCWEDRT